MLAVKTTVSTMRSSKEFSPNKYDAGGQPEINTATETRNADNLWNYANLGFLATVRSIKCVQIIATMTDTRNYSCFGDKLAIFLALTACPSLSRSLFNTFTELVVSKISNYFVDEISTLSVVVSEM